MAEGFLCARCGHQESAHEIAYKELGISGDEIVAGCAMSLKSCRSKGNGISFFNGFTYHPNDLLAVQRLEAEKDGLFLTYILGGEQ